MPTPDGVSRLALVIMGVAGSGKTSVGEVLARKLGLLFVDGDDLHPAANVRKMASGAPLTDDDRWPWLDRVAEVLRDRTTHPAGVCVACSALRRVYRDRIRTGAPDAEVRFVFLDITPAVSQARLHARKGHFMPVSLVKSQFETLERPAPDEADVVTILETHGVDETAATAAHALLQTAAP